MIFDVPPDVKVVHGSVKVGFCEGCNHPVKAIIMKNRGIPTPVIGCEEEISIRQDCPQPLVVNLGEFEELRQRPVESQTNI